jgi:hypothetical protein
MSLVLVLVFEALAGLADAAWVGDSEGAVLHVVYIWAIFFGCKPELDLRMEELHLRMDERDVPINEPEVPTNEPEVPLNEPEVLTNEPELPTRTLEIGGFPDRKVVSLFATMTPTQETQMDLYLQYWLDRARGKPCGVIGRGRKPRNRAQRISHQLGCMRVAVPRGK